MSGHMVVDIQAIQEVADRQSCIQRISCNTIWCCKKSVVYSSAYPLPLEWLGYQLPYDRSCECAIYVPICATRSLLRARVGWGLRCIWRGHARCRERKAPGSPSSVHRSRGLSDSFQEL